LYAPNGQEMASALPPEETPATPSPSRPSRQVLRAAMRRQAQEHLKNFHFGGRDGAPDPPQRRIKRVLARHAAATAWQLGDREIEGIRVQGDE
jgi:hypothetical protein